MTSWSEKHQKKKSAKDLIPQWFLEAKNKNYDDVAMADVIRKNLADRYPDLQDYQVQLILGINNELYENI